MLTISYKILEKGIVKNLSFEIRNLFSEPLYTRELNIKQKTLPGIFILCFIQTSGIPSFKSHNFQEP